MGAGRSPAGGAEVDAGLGPVGGAEVDLVTPGRLHVVGVGGAGMSAIAEVLAAMGHHVTGSDRADSVTLRRLEGLGVGTWVGWRPDAVADLRALTASTAVGPDDPEVQAARRAGVACLTRAEMLSAICQLRSTLAVAGTHGKTTTSAMLAGILVDAGLRPAFVVGGTIAGLGSGARWDDGRWLVAEADESDGTFLSLGAEGVIVTSLEPDHLDFYGDLDHLEAAFLRFAASAPGPKVVCADTAGSARLAQAIIDRPGVVSYGTSPDAEVRLESVTSGRDSIDFAVRRGRRLLGTIGLAVPGIHNARNAVAALTLATEIGVDFEVAASSLRRFAGVARRFENRGTKRGVTFVDDYGHLPAEVATTVATAAAGGWDRLVVVFQPHRYSRTATLWREFAGAFGGADVVVVTDVYPSGEAPLAGITGALVADAVRAGDTGADVRYVPDRAGLARALEAELRPGDLCLTLGAGDLTKLPDEVFAAGESP